MKVMSGTSNDAVFLPIVKAAKIIPTGDESDENE